MLEELVHLRVHLQVQPDKRHPVLRQEVADPEGVSPVPVPDHAHACEGSRPVQEPPSGDERLKDDIAQVGMVVQDLPQGVG
ncbi:MAG: hypothetical protein ACREWE_06945 [Gammaproteobacteria bacterium]